ncbi:hypothetical protein STRTUCAR8_01251 [Streptomyces turgidiscabies Car8]|uniref:Uncharacterized protein n=1 Tax=Streptomyces turgidiscabies (strain Car8) TaxID=698760 RepID=L7F217_STRT8|nr:hypothetical protein STRTUCAR8_01251 [Streptomyces turgidiscabies Car8]
MLMNADVPGGGGGPRSEGPVVPVVSEVGVRPAEVGTASRPRPFSGSPDDGNEPPPPRRSAISLSETPPVDTPVPLSGTSVPAVRRRRSGWSPGTS